MTDATHTQGPWTVSQPSGNYIDTPTGSVAALTYGATKADAHLIAAAPDLLEALEGAYRHFLQHMERDWFDDDDQDVMQKMFDAIAKAKGN